MDIAFRDEFFNRLCKISDYQFDSQAKIRLKNLIGRSNEDIKDELFGIIDDCVFYSWCNLKALEFIWKKIGGVDNEVHKNRMNLPDAKLKYKWQR